MAELTALVPLGGRQVEMRRPTDGGLVVPQVYPRLDAGELAALRPLAYPDLAYAIISRFVDDITQDDLAALVQHAYRTETFGSADITPLQTLEPGLHLLKLSNSFNVLITHSILMYVQILRYQLPRLKSGRLLL